MAKTSDDEKKDGTVRIKNELYDAMLSARLSAAMLTAFLYIVRKTIGFNKIEDKISISKMASETGFSRQAMTGAVHDLEQKGMISSGARARGRLPRFRVNDPSYWDRDP